MSGVKFPTHSLSVCSISMAIIGVTAALLISVRRASFCAYIRNNVQHRDEFPYRYGFTSWNYLVVSGKLQDNEHACSTKQTARVVLLRLQATRSIIVDFGALSRVALRRR